MILFPDRKHPHLILNFCLLYLEFHHSEYPSLSPSDWLYGEDLQHTIDFRGIYGTILQQWMGIDPYEIVGGDFEQINPYKKTLI